jgi:spore coat polysaccharide biosynthesis protein SpsF
MNNNIAFRCSGDSLIGLGHIVGSVRFAQIIKKEFNINPVFIINNNNSVEDYLLKNGIERRVIISEDLTIEEELNLIDKTLQNTNTNIISFNLSARQLSKWGDSFSSLKDVGRKIIFQDNPTKSFVYADIVINPLVHPDYAKYSPDKHRACFDGLEYMLWDNKIKKHISKKREYNISSKRILIAMGGGDPENTTLLILKVLDEINCNYYIDVVLGSVSTHIDSIKSFLKNTTLKINLSVNVDDMAERIWNADLGFSSFGLTTYEMAALGLPCIIITQNDLCEKVAKKYTQKYKLALYATNVTDFNKKKIISSIDYYLDNKSSFFEVQKQRAKTFKESSLDKVFQHIKELFVL